MYNTGIYWWQANKILNSHVYALDHHYCQFLISISTWKAIIPFLFGQTAFTIFFVITALIVWSHFCESCYGFLRPFFNKMSKKYGFATGRLVWELLRFFTALFQQNVEKYGFATGRTAMFFWFEHFFWSLRVKTIFYKKKSSLRLFPLMTRKFCVFGFPGIYTYIYIYRCYFIPWKSRGGWNARTAAGHSCVIGCVRNPFHESSQTA